MSIHRRTTKRGTVYDVRLRDPEGKEYCRTFPTRKRAETFEAGERADRSRGTWVDPRGAEMLFGDVARQWLASNPAKRPSGWARDEVILRRHILPMLESRPIGVIAPKDVRALMASWSSVVTKTPTKTDNEAGTRKKRAPAPRTVKRQYGVLRAVMNYAVQTDVITRTPCRGVKLPAVTSRKRRVVSPDELLALADALGPDHGPMAFLGAVLGLRWGECAGLRVGRVDFLRGTVAVLEQVTRGPKGTTVVGPPKSEAGRRTLAVPSALMALLSDVLARRGLTGADVDALLFTSPRGDYLDYSHWRRRVWMPACEQAKLAGLGFHDLRRANATRLVDSGVDVKTAQSRLGHSDVRLTLELYAQVVSESDRAAAAGLGDHFMAPAEAVSGARAG